MYFLFWYSLLNKRSRSDDIATSNAVKHWTKKKIWQQYKRFTFVISCNAVILCSTLYSNVLMLCEQSKAMTPLQKFIECLVSSLATSLIPHRAIQNQYNIFLPINNVSLKKVQMHASTVGCN